MEVFKIIKVSKVVGKFELSVVLDESNLLEVKDTVSKILIDFKNKEESYFIVESDKHSNLIDVENDCSEMINYIDSILNNPNQLLDFIDELPKKKNGSYYKGRVKFLKRMDNCCDFYTDFTNAWSLPVLRLKVISDTECNVEFNIEQITF